MTYDYREEFIRACKATRSLGFPCPTPVLTDRLIFVDERNIEKLTNLISTTIENIRNTTNYMIMFKEHYQENNPEFWDIIVKVLKKDPQYLFCITQLNNCLVFHISLMNYMNKYSFYKSYLTIGYIHENHQNIYYLTVENFRQWLNQETINFWELPIHAWLTLESSEIIDATWLTSLGFLDDNEDLIGRSYNCHPGRICRENKREYHPVVVATDEMVRIIERALRFD